MSPWLWPVAAVVILGILSCFEVAIWTTGTIGERWRRRRQHRREIREGLRRERTNGTDEG